MNLLIDIGNTSLKWAQCDGGVPAGMQTVRHHGGLPIDLHAAWELIGTPARILVSNVGAEGIAEALERACRVRWDRRPTFVVTEARSHGVAIAYERPERLGVDRWLALIAARRICTGAALIVDAGTAVTYDLLLPDGRHLGGLIVPGVEMMRDSLLAGTSIPRTEPVESAEPWAADTAAAIAAGSIQAPAALAERLRDRLEAIAGDRPEVLMTGGNADRLLPAVAPPHRHVPDLVLRGLALLA
jgi:type III pantothenate kinase